MARSEAGEGYSPKSGSLGSCPCESSPHGLQASKGLRVSRSQRWDLVGAPTYPGGVRDGSLTRVLIGSLMLMGCRSATSTGGEQTDGVRAEAEPARVEPSAKKSDEPAKVEASADHAERIADLDVLCRALDHDYVDGTLSDYYAKIEPKTAWGRERLREGEESITPGRLLQNATTQIAANLESPELAGCRKLFDEIDELE